MYIFLQNFNALTRGWLLLTILTFDYVIQVIQDKMDEVLTNSNSRVCIVGLYGMGGIGKTTISKALCNNLALKLCDNVCHIELASGSELELLGRKRELESLRKVLKKLSKIRHDLLDKLDDLELVSVTSIHYH